MELRPIPAFYCCYLLRSSGKNPSLYVGSTPNARRRLAQHNGLLAGGAAQTARRSLESWEMTCIVKGFPSSISALQFEWAWQNSHLTRKISDDQRITMRKYNTKVSKSGRTRKCPARPCPSLKEKLLNLHLLLRVPSFQGWPLEVSFFSAHVHRTWLRYAANAEKQIRSSIRVHLDLGQPVEPETAKDGVSKDRINGRPSQDITTTGGLQGLCFTYAPLKAHVEKSLFMLAEGESVHCSVCRVRIETPAVMVLVCPNPECRDAFHMNCLAKQFVELGSDVSLLPTYGRCPGCEAELSWARLVTELSLRMRGNKEVTQLLKQPRKRKAKPEENIDVIDLDGPDDAYYSDDGDKIGELENDAKAGLCLNAVLDEPLLNQAEHHLDTEDADDVASVTSTSSNKSQIAMTGHPRKPRSESSRLEIVIEDSDWNAAEVLD